MSLMLPKSPPLRLPSHLERVRAMACLSTGQTPSDPHHLKMGWYRKGEKPPDNWVLPLVSSEHRRLHDIGEAKFWRELLNRDKQLLADVMKAFARSLYQDEMVAHD